MREEAGLALAEEKALETDFLRLRRAAERAFPGSAGDEGAFYEKLRWEIVPTVRIVRSYDVSGAPGREGGEEHG